MAKVVIEAKYCKSCELCVSACPKEVLRVGKALNFMGYHVVEADESKECIGCMNCSVMCPEGAIEVYR